MWQTSNNQNVVQASYMELAECTRQELQRANEKRDEIYWIREVKQ